MSTELIGSNLLLAIFSVYFVLSMSMFGFDLFLGNIAFRRSEAFVDVSLQCLSQQVGLLLASVICLALSKDPFQNSRSVELLCFQFNVLILTALSYIALQKTHDMQRRLTLSHVKQRLEGALKPGVGNEVCGIYCQAAEHLVDADFYTKKLWGPDIKAKKRALFCDLLPDTLFDKTKIGPDNLRVDADDKCRKRIWRCYVFAGIVSIVLHIGALVIAFWVVRSVSGGE